MAGMGPPPKPAGTRARRNAAPQTTKLPADGRASKRTPTWPLPADLELTVDKRLAEAEVKQLRLDVDDCEDPARLRRLRADLKKAERTAALLKAKLAQQAAMERRLWSELWKTPQAAMWEKLAWGRDVAQYVRHKVRAETGSLDDAKEARQWSDRLGLNPLAMLRLRWETERTEDAEARGKQRRERPAPAAKTGSQPAVDPRSILRAVN